MGAACPRRGVPERPLLRPRAEGRAVANVGLGGALAAAHEAWGADRFAEAARLYEAVLRAAASAGDSPGALPPKEFLQCRANLGSCYMMLAEDVPAPDLQQREALLGASLEHWKAAQRNGPGSPLLDYFLASVSRDLAQASAGAARLRSAPPAAGPPPAAAVPTAVERRPAAGLGYEEFCARYLERGVPVVITGLDVPRWGFEALEELCGDVEVPCVRYDAATSGKEWGALSQGGRAPLREHLRRARDPAPPDGAACAPMLFDHALADVCPALLEQLVVPRYFAVDYLRAIPAEERQGVWPSPARFPSLFVQPAGTKCGLHVDQAATHFYQALLAGRKRWRLFLQGEAHLLYPRGHGLLFEYDAFAPDLRRFPLAASAAVAEAVLGPGDVLFVPQGVPHQILNEEPSIAISANYVPGHGLGAVLEELSLLSQAGARPEYSLLAEKLRAWAPAPGSERPQDPGDLQWSEFDAASWLGRAAPGG